MSLDLLFGTISFSVEIGREKVCVCEREGEGETNFSIFDPLGLKGVESVGLSPHVLSQPLQKVHMYAYFCCCSCFASSLSRMDREKALPHAAYVQFQHLSVRLSK